MITVYKADIKMSLSIIITHDIYRNEQKKYLKIYTHTSVTAVNDPLASLTILVK